MSPLYIKQSVNLIDKDNKIDFNSWNIYFWCQGIHNTKKGFYQHLAVFISSFCMNFKNLKEIEITK